MEKLLDRERSMGVPQSCQRTDGRTRPNVASARVNTETKVKMPLHMTHSAKRSRRVQGFSLLELMIVVAIMLVVAAYAIPIWTTSVRLARIRGAETSYAGLLQMARTRAVNDDRYYSVYTKLAAGNNPQMAYVDIYPQNVNGTSGNGPTGNYVAGPPADPMVTLSPEAVPKPALAAPNTANLYATFCSACATRKKNRVK